MQQSIKNSADVTAQNSLVKNIITGNMFDTNMDNIMEYHLKFVHKTYVSLPEQEFSVPYLIWLRENKWRNIRNQDPKKVSAIAEEMKRHQGLKKIGHLMRFNTEGEVIDMGHRILAAIETNIPLLVIPICGITKEAESYIDNQQTTRTAQVVLAGKETGQYDKAKVSLWRRVIGMIVLYKQLRDRENRKLSVPLLETEFNSSRKGMYEFIIQRPFSKNVPNKAGFRVAIMECWKAFPDKAEEFLSSIEKGKYERGDNESPGGFLLNWFAARTQENKSNTQKNQTEECEVTLAAFLHFLRGEKMDRKRKVSFEKWDKEIASIQI